MNPRRGQLDAPESGFKQRLNEAERAGRLSHAWLVIRPEGSGRLTLARQLIAAMQCTADGERPCMRCTACKKVLSDMHPDVITVDAPDKKTIPVKLVRDACADLFVRPNEGARKVYLFPRAHELNAQGQNALLKCIEEPPPYGAFFLLSEQPLLPTVQSRCVELRLCPLPEATLLRALGQRAPSSTDAQRRTAAAQSEGYLGRALRLLEAGGGLLPQTEALSVSAQVQAENAGDNGEQLEINLDDADNLPDADAPLPADAPDYRPVDEDDDGNLIFEDGTPDAGASPEGA